MKCYLCEKEKPSGMIYKLDIGNKFICSCCDRSNNYVKKHSQILKTTEDKAF